MDIKVLIEKAKYLIKNGGSNNLKYNEIINEISNIGLKALGKDVYGFRVKMLAGKYANDFKTIRKDLTQDEFNELALKALDALETLDNNVDNIYHIISILLNVEAKMRGTEYKEYLNNKDLSIKEIIEKTIELIKKEGIQEKNVMVIGSMVGMKLIDKEGIELLEKIKKSNGTKESFEFLNKIMFKFNDVNKCLIEAIQELPIEAKSLAIILDLIAAANMVIMNKEVKEEKMTIEIIKKGNTVQVECKGIIEDKKSIEYALEKLLKNLKN